jgi:hypothetical protein
MDNILYEKQLKCPVCNNNFTTCKVRSSKLRVEKRDSDFFTIYKTENPIKYSVFVCPECGYSALERTFDKIKSGNKDIIKEKITSKWNKRDYSGERSVEKAIECYKLALYCGQLLDIGSYDLAVICLRLAWLYRILENEEEERRFLKFSVDSYEDFFYNGVFTEDTSDEITVGYLIGEIHRRLGEYNKAISWFSKTLSNQAIKLNPRIEKMTREQWYVAKESAKGE